MAKLLTIGKTNADNSGILYVLVVRLDCGTEVYKVGVTKRKIEERVAEILTSFWLSYRYFPYCYPNKNVYGIPPKDEEVSVMESILKLYSNLSIEGKDYIKVRLEMIGELDVSK